MQAVGRLGSYISRGVYTVSAPFHPFGGAVDIIVVEQPDGSFKSSPWYVRFGKFQGVLKTREKVVNISVNGVEANFHMYLDHKGEAYFLREADGEEGESVLYPLPCAGETDGQSNNYRKSVKSKSYNYDSGQSNPADQVDMSNGKILSRTNSRRARILGLVFGGRSMKEDGFGEAAGNAGMIRASSLERAEIAANLLEVKWSTNLASRRSRKDNASQFVVGDVLDGKGTKNMQINDGQGQVNSSARDHVDQIGPSSWCGMNPKCSIGEASIEMSRLRSVEQIAENSVSDQSILENNSEVLSRDLSNAEVGAVNNHHDVNGGDISDMTCSDFQIQHEFDASPSMLSVEEQDCEEFGAGLPGSVVYEESGSPRVDSFLYCETSESSVVSFDGSCEQTHQKLYLATGGLGEFHVHAESLHATSEYIPKDTVSEPAMSVVLEVEELLTKPESFTHMVSIETTVGSVEPADSGSIGMTSGGGNLAHRVQHENEIQDDFHPFDSAGDSQDFDGDPPSKFLEEEQFLFSDIDKSKFGELKHLGSISRDLLNENSNPSFCREGNKGVTVSLGGEPYLTPDKDVDDNSSDDRENIVENSRPTSSCISIPRSHRLACGGEDGRVVESLPSSWSPIHDLDSHQRHPVSHSLDTDSKSVKWTLLSKDETSSVKSAAGKQHQLAREQKEHLVAQEQPNFEDCQNTVEMELVLANQEVELSLCKHLLHEGMGAEAASQAFDAEKLDRDKFTSLGPSILKHDKLVVRVGGRYFPWDAAAPIISGKVSFGSGDVFEPKGMIAVDCYEKLPEVDSSKGSISPGGSWRLWPFPFNRSRSTEALPPVSNDARSDAESISGDTICSDGDENVHKPKVMKKMIKAMSPTSEQLASLNLMEGGNSVTFTFSTAMLGNQQVDARIYLWKWNTRIVISDVDGTITKSDVLGQFMPLVGIDWSQTGVAHLFSAIKENGYQLLFLSARAISQAYLTRQFLLNLKQDGKALPDGPVVISPDGLFPSLFREVIRRAPHEFKIACLEDIKALFPSDCNPFYAGFGNRDTDEISYLKVGIPRGKIFIINPKGEVAVNRRVDTKSYSSLQALVHGMFPAMTSFEQEDFNSWNFWKLPPPIIDI